jgi:hypothetical protein
MCAETHRQCYGHPMLTCCLTNKRKRRHGAFREDRYHVTAFAADEHLHRCLSVADAVQKFTVQTLNEIDAGQPAPT